MNIKWWNTACSDCLIYLGSTNNICSFQGSSFVSLLPVVRIEQKPPPQVKAHIPLKSHTEASCLEVSCSFTPTQITMSLQTRTVWPFLMEHKTKCQSLSFPCNEDACQKTEPNTKQNKTEWQSKGKQNKAITTQSRQNKKWQRQSKNVHSYIKQNSKLNPNNNKKLIQKI